MAACKHCLVEFPCQVHITFCPSCGITQTRMNEKLLKIIFMDINTTSLFVLLMKKHGIEMTVRTLKRSLKSYHLSRQNENISEDNVRTLLRQEMQAAGGSLAGYRKMWHIRIKHHVHVPRKLVATILRQLDPEASIRRRRKRLQRRQYISQGPNQCWHIDGYDKLKPFGFPIHGAVDGFSRKVLWLEVVKSNNAPESVAQLYLDAVRRYRGCPHLIVVLKMV
ncbi:uncharacterized protein LOC124435940 [Xenia sp. Carnegie-2017]|uniref:uncharacterized protein LOC124435940 n=1 Tax=Xenia sp. Carnegie-2017 TaxID=2897299 RepID=UPI001F049F9F|nr:uncharacterized protein LOC124435940 [Xenia sp. Carnegie-2017]